MGLPFPVVKNLTAELRAVFPRPFILYMNDCVDRWPHIPPALDLVGMDRYTVSRNGTDEVRGAKAYFAASVFPKLREHQRKSPRLRSHCWSPAWRPGPAKNTKTSPVSRHDIAGIWVAFWPRCEH